MCYYYQVELRLDTREDFPRLRGTAGRRTCAGGGQGPYSPENLLGREGLKPASTPLTARLPLAGMRGQALRLGALRLLLFKLLLLDVLLTCSRLRAAPCARGDPGLPRPARARSPTAGSRSPRRPAWPPSRGGRRPGAPEPSLGGGDALYPPSLGLVLMSPPVFLP